MFFGSSCDERTFIINSQQQKPAKIIEINIDGWQ